MSKDREAKHVLRAIRDIPVDQIASQLADYEGEYGKFCIVNGYFEYVDIRGRYESHLDDPIQAALLVRYIQTLPDRHYSTYESALEYVKQQISR